MTMKISHQDARESNPLAEAKNGKPLKGLVFLALVFLLFTIPAMAQDSGVTADDVNAVAKQLYCPVCESQPLDTCGTAACIQWREEIRVQLESGRTEQQVIDDFVARYGDRVVGTPQDPTLRALSLVTPWVVAVIVVAAAATLLIRWRRGRGEAAAVSPNGAATLIPEDEYRARLERDLAKRR